MDMNRPTLSFAAKLGICAVILGTTVLLTAGVGLYTVGVTEASLRRTVEVDSKSDLASRLSAALSEMSAAQRGVVLSSFGKNPAGVAAAAKAFEENGSKFQRALAEARPLATAPREREAVSEMERRMAQWLPAYAELLRLAESGDPEGASRVLGDRTAAPCAGVGAGAAELARAGGDLLRNERQASANGLGLARWLTLWLLAGTVLFGGFAAT